MCFSKTWRHGYCALRNLNNLCYALFKWSLGLINHPSSWNVQVKTHKQARVYLLLQTSLVKTPVRTFKTAGTGLEPKSKWEKTILGIVMWAPLVSPKPVPCSDLPKHVDERQAFLNPHLHLHLLFWRPGGREWGLADGKQADWPISLPFIWVKATEELV